MRQWAEEEFVIPEGKCKGFLWNPDTQPWAKLWLEELDTGKWIEHYLAGCVQGGKSLHGYVIPILHAIFERKETVVCGIPTLDLSTDKWREEILPAILAREEFRACLPQKGPGSRGGTGNLNAIKFTHDPTLKFMSAGGGEEKQSSFTTRVVIMTECDKMDTAGEVSRETDPVGRMINRTSSYDLYERFITGECTVSLPGGFIWRKWLEGTGSVMACPCPACGEHITPEIDDFKGFENCETSADAQENAYFECRLCGHHITAAERREMNRRGKLLHRGQTIDRDGNVHGDPPRTHIFAFRWNCFNNMFWSVEAIAHKAWQVAHAAEIADELESDPESIRKEWLQFYWAMPYEPPQLDDAPLQAKYVCKRKDADLDQFEIPEDTQYLVAGLDVHKRWIYYLVMAFCQSGKIHICDYDRVSVPSDIMTEQKAVRHALMELDDHLQKGFPIVGRGDRRLPDRAAVDTGYLTKDVFAFINAAGDNEVQYLGVKGFGISRKSGDFRSPYSAPKKIGQEVRLIGEEFHLARITKYRAFQMMVHSDYWIARLQNCLTLSMDASGAVSMFNAMEKSRHFRIATHFASHRWVNGKREIHGEDHWLDCGAYAFAAGRYLGYKFSVAEDDASRGATPPTHWFASARAGRGQHVPT